MNCLAARELLWEADPAELMGRVGSSLSRHLETCEACRRLADAILNAQAALEHSITASRSRTSVENALRMAAATARLRRRRRMWEVTIPFAAAAGVAGLLLLARRAPELPGEIWEPPTAAPVAGPAVEAPPGKDVAVFKIADRPDVVVVWFFDQGDE